MAFSRSDNEVASCPGRKFDWWPRAYSRRVGNSYFISNDVLSSSVVPALVTPPTLHEKYVKNLGRNVRIRGFYPVRRYPGMCSSAIDLSFLQWESRLLPLDPVTVAHILKNPTIYEKPFISRRLIEWLIGCGMLAAEGHVHKRQRRVATPAFSIQNMRAFVPLVFNKGEELKDRWMGLIQEHAIKDSQ